MNPVEKELKRDLKATLANDVCSAQCLDVPADRNRVLKEITKTLLNGKYVFYVKSSSSSTSS